MSKISCLVVAMATVLSLLWSCEGKKNTPATEPEEKAFEYNKEQLAFQKSSEGCKSDSNECAKVSIDYPQFREKGLAFQRINDSILHYIKMSLSIEDDKIDHRTTLEELGNRFIQDYNEYTAESKTRAEEEGTDPFVTPWEIEISGQVTFESPKAVSIILSNYAYTGGAHPNSNVTLLMYEAKTGKPLKIKDLVKNQSGLIKLAERKFRETNELGPNENLNDRGYFWDGKFQLPANIGLEAQGLYFYYNSYEIAAYAYGATEFVLTWEELGDLLDLSKIK